MNYIAVLGALSIFFRQVTELSHRRKLVAFLFLLPLLLMGLFGAALGNETVPAVPVGSQSAVLNDLRSNQNLSILFSILGGLMGGHPSPVRILAASFRSPTNSSSKALLYVVPYGRNTSVVIVDEGSSSYYSAIISSNGILMAAGGPASLPLSSKYETIPQVDLQPLYSDETAVKLAQAVVAIFRLGLVLELNQRRLLDVIFPEIVGLEIGWVGILGSAVTAVEDRVAGARRRILMTPVSRASFVLGNAIGSFTLIGLQLIVLFATAIFAFHVSVNGSILGLVPIISAASFSVIGVGLIISHFSKTPDEAFYLSTLVNLPMGFLSSQFIPLAQNPLSILIQSLLPMTFANRALIAIIVAGASLQAVLPELLILGVFAASLYSVGTVMVMRER